MKTSSATLNWENSSLQPTSILENLRKNVESREQLGVLLIDFLLRETATGKHFREDGVAEIPLIATLRIETQSTESDSTVCTTTCISFHNQNIWCYQTCHTVHVQ